MRRIRAALGVMALAAMGGGLFALPRLHVAAAPSTGFNDVPAVYWAAGPIERLAGVHIIAPDHAGNFRPDEPITRGEYASWLLAARHIYPAQPSQAPFPDVPAIHPLAGAAETAYRLALLEPDRSGNFLIDSPISRQEAALAALRAAGKDQLAHTAVIDEHIAGLPFQDAWEIGKTYLPYVAAAYRLSWVEGVTSASFRPAAPLTRAEAAAFLARVLLPEGEAPPLGAVLAATNEPVFQSRRGTGLRPLAEIPMRATEYGAGEPWLSNTTFTGIRVRRGLVAVDPTVIPLGSILYVEGYGYALAADTGSAIKGKRIDLYSQDAKEVALFGIQSRRVWVLE